MNGTAEGGTSGTNDKNLFFQWYNETTNSIVIIDESSHTLYAYLLREKNKIVSDVWLYNTDATPEVPPWLSDKGKNAPYPNSKNNMSERQLKYDANKNYFSVHFGLDGERHLF